MHLLEGAVLHVRVCLFLHAFYGDKLHRHLVHTERHFAKRTPAQSTPDSIEIRSTLQGGGVLSEVGFEQCLNVRGLPTVSRRLVLKSDGVTGPLGEHLDLDRLLEQARRLEHCSRVNEERPLG